MPSFFISSTFRDMHPERDVLHRQVFPEIEASAKQYGDHVNLCDLRWGIDTDELNEREGVHKILKGCLDGIDRCGDYLIAFIGDRYGYIPEMEYLEEILGERGDFRLSGSPISVTELEMRYALGKEKNPQGFRHTVVYMRTIKGNPSARYRSEDEVAARRSQEFKRKLQSISNLTIKEYCLNWDDEKDQPTKNSLDDFARLLSKDLLDMLEKEWVKDEACSAFERDRRIHREYGLRKCAGSLQRKHVIQECFEHIENHPVTALTGPIGIGKSTLMSQLATVVQNQGDFCVIFYGGYTPFSGTAEKILQHMLSSLGSQLGETLIGDDPDNQSLTIAEQLEILDENLLRLNAQLKEKKKQFYFFIDAVDQLVPDEYRENLIFITDVLAECKYIHIVISAAESFAIPARIPTFIVPHFARNEIILAAEAIADMEFKELSAYVQDCILSQSMSKNPLYLSLLVKRLLMMDQADFKAIDNMHYEPAPISAYQGHLIFQLDAALYDISKEISDLAAKRIGGDMVQHCLLYLAVSRYGLTESELEKLFEKQGAGFCYLDFSMFIRYLDIFFIRRMDGKIDFAHQSLRKGILKQHMLNEEEIRTVNHELAVLFSEEPEETSDIEMYWHLLEAEDYESFYDNLNLIKTREEQCWRMAGIVKLWMFLRHSENALINYPIEKRSIDLFNDLAVLFSQYICVLSKGSQQDRVFAFNLEKKLLEAGNNMEGLGIDGDTVSNEHFLRNMMIIRNVLAEVIAQKRTEGALWEAIRYLEMNLPYLETEPTDPTLRMEALYKDRITDYERLSDLYAYIGGENNLRKSYQYLLMAVETAELYVNYEENEDSLDSILSIYLRMAKQTDNIFTLNTNTRKDEKDSQRHNSAYYYEKSCEYINKIIRLAEEHDENESIYIELLDVAAYGYDSLSEHYYQMGDQKHLKLAEDLCIKAIEVGKRISRLQGHINRKTIQGASYLRLALIYEELDMDLQEKDRLIEQNLQRGSYIYKSLMEELGTPDSMRDYAVSLGRMALHYQDLADKISLHKGLACIAEALKIYNKLVTNMPTPSLKDGQAKEKGIKADLFKAMNTRKSLMKGNCSEPLQYNSFT